uniref:CUB domain-containing protein n=1 Tax=Echeneis naucrates TaxID=173247 RepID=A0A665ST37_ECHNA
QKHKNVNEQCFYRDGSVVAHFWIGLSVPGSHVGRVTPKEVTASLEHGLLGKGSRNQELANCYRYQKVVSRSPTALRGPDTQRSSCLWHLQAAPGSQLELHMEWLLPECRDRLAVYDSFTPTDTRLITSVYGCSRHERVVRVLSSGEWMAVVWKQGLYNYKDPFSLSAQYLSFPDCNSTIELKAVLGVQGTLRTPFFPSYYPPDTNCTWSFMMPGAGMGLSLEFEGYELSRASYNQGFSEMSYSWVDIKDCSKFTVTSTCTCTLPSLGSRSGGRYPERVTLSAETTPGREG